MRKLIISSQKITLHGGLSIHYFWWANLIHGMLTRWHLFSKKTATAATTAIKEHSSNLKLIYCLRIHNYKLLEIKLEYTKLLKNCRAPYRSWNELNLALKSLSVPIQCKLDQFCVSCEKNLSPLWILQISSIVQTQKEKVKKCLMHKQCD